MLGRFHVPAKLEVVGENLFCQLAVDDSVNGCGVGCENHTCRAVVGVGAAEHLHQRLLNILAASGVNIVLGVSLAELIESTRYGLVLIGCIELEVCRFHKQRFHTFGLFDTWKLEKDATFLSHLLDVGCNYTKLVDTCAENLIRVLDDVVDLILNIFLYVFVRRLWIVFNFLYVLKEALHVIARAVVILAEVGNIVSAQ